MFSYGSAQQITKKGGAPNDQQQPISIFGVIMTDSPVRHIAKKANRYSDRLRSRSPQPALSNKMLPPSKTFNLDIKKTLQPSGLDRSTGSSVTKGSAPNQQSGASSQVVTSKSSGVHQAGKPLTQAVSRARSPHASEHLTLTDQTLQLTRNSSPQPLANQTGGISPRSQVYVASMVSVLVRVRPPNKIESKLVTSGEAFECLSVENEVSNIGVKLKIRNKLGEIRHAEVTGLVDEQTDNSQLFLKWVRPCIAKVLDGYNLSVLCYGVTGAGKTHTMFGDKWEEGSRGVVYEAAEHLLNLKEQSQGTGMRIHIEVSIFEIYNENIRDLSYPNPISLNCCEDPRGEVYVKDLRKFPVTSLEELRLFLQSGNSRRVKASTNKNMHSSRSHAIVEFTLSSVSINADGKNDGNVKVGRLLLIDLAGSERLDTVSEQSTSSYPGSTQPEKQEIARKQE